MNAPDALALAQFRADITDGVARGTSHSGRAALVGPNGCIALQQIEDHRPPTWPGGGSPVQLHLELLVDDLEAAWVRVLAARSTLLDFQSNRDQCLVYTDPAGHPFCLSTV